MLEIAVLGLLKDQEMHGYELKRRLQEVLGFQAAVSFGSLYPTLAKLEAAGAIEAVAQAPEGATSARASKRTAILSRRRRKVYRLTSSGAAQFNRLLAEPSTSYEDDPSFNSRFAFASHLDPQGRLRLLEGRRRALAARLARVSATAHRADKYLGVLVARQREALARDLSWVDRLISDERAALEGAYRSYGQPASFGQTAGENPPPVPLASASQLRRARMPRPAT